MPSNSEISLNPQSAKGDILTHDGSSRSRFPLGSSNQVISANSTASLGIEWITPPPSQTDYNPIYINSTTTSTITSFSITGLSNNVAGQGTSADPYYVWYQLSVDIPVYSTGTSYSATIRFNNKTSGSDGILFEYPYYTYGNIETGKWNWATQNWSTSTNAWTNTTYNIPLIGSQPIQGYARSIGGFSGGNEVYEYTGYRDSSPTPAGVTSIQIVAVDGTGFPVGTTIALYGIKGANY